MSKIWLLAFGGNLPSEVGLPRVTLNRAVLTLNSIGDASEATQLSGKVKLKKVSRFFATPCFPAGAGPDYVNAAALIESPLEADELLALLHDVEAKFGRARSSRWVGRTLDIDLIGGGGVVLPNPETYAYWRDLPLERQLQETPDQLILPHPRLQDRAFVLVPLNDIAPDWKHPVSGLSVGQMLAALPETDRKAVKPL